MMIQWTPRMARLVELTEDDLERLRTSTEDNLVERKTSRDKRGWLLSAVAFANSAPIGAPAVLFIGVGDNGAYENLGMDHDWEKQQKTVTEELNRAYPPLYPVFKICKTASGTCLAVIITGSAARPHFTGKSYIRIGPETRDATERQFNALIAERNSRAYEIRKWIGKQVSVAWFKQGVLTPHKAMLLDCNQIYFTTKTASPEESISYPLNKTEVSFNHQWSCLQLEVRDLP